MDAFERFGLPRRLVFEPGLIEDAVNRKLEAAHPDRGGREGEFEDLKKAGDLLCEPFGRLGLALEVVGIDASERGSVPGQVMDYFSPVAEILQRVDRFVGERSRAVSVLGKAVLDVQVPDLKAELERLIGSLSSLEKELHEEFGKFDQVGWRECGEKMAESHRALSFLRKWLAQLREATGKIFEALLAGP